ncbi:hypothetical protein [Georgenia sp. AZ-5]|uniref:hypothetical protein n=1 Tax=Georgenia sp. AZ-5 TaxID=3367526 RepID=UPI003754DD35
MSTFPFPAPCTPADGPCRSYRPRHLVHMIQAKYLRLTPDGWRDGIVGELGPRGTAVVHYLAGGRVTVWNHHGFAVAAPAGSPVRIHERYHALQSGRAVLCVQVLGRAAAQVTVP